jgi:hypothetical protein
MHPYVDAISHREAWPDESSVKGIICNGNKITWKLHCVCDYNMNSVPARYYGFHASCEGRLACTAQCGRANRKSFEVEIANTDFYS